MLLERSVAATVKVTTIQERKINDFTVLTVLLATEFFAPLTLF